MYFAQPSKHINQERAIGVNPFHHALNLAMLHLPIWLGRSAVGQGFAQPLNGLPHSLCLHPYGTSAQDAHIIGFWLDCLVKDAYCSVSCGWMAVQRHIRDDGKSIRTG
ncbi:hypothetical protein N7471_011493 [Penicillium samsonianum]|uniref:uncharacterized protein n=1 Tax=Penicillium samsonianum TaxID=1882272 RepID=UPI0025482A9F|nr:uncharacterized protein N7471_011493 [Penicillium samsonianum]KAJ6124176.1 hypothetical protein N7471_011493 [Penicillium samsonianum]